MATLTVTPRIAMNGKRTNQVSFECNSDLEMLTLVPGERIECTSPGYSISQASSLCLSRYQKFGYMNTTVEGSGRVRSLGGPSPWSPRESCCLETLDITLGYRSGVFAGPV